MNNKHPLIIPTKHLLVMGLSSICGLYGAIKINFLAYNLAYSLGLGGFMSWAVSMPFLIIGAVLSFGLFVQGCKYFKAWPMNTETKSTLFLISSPSTKSWMDKVVEFPEIFLNDCKSALRSFDRSLLESLSHFFVSENSPKYKKWMNDSNELDNAENKNSFSQVFQNAWQATNLAVKNFIRTRGVPAIAQGIICKKIHAMTIKVLHKNKILAMKCNGKITDQALDAESTQAAILTMYNCSLSDKGIVETIMTAAYSEYKNPPKAPVART